MKVGIRARGWRGGRAQSKENTNLHSTEIMSQGLCRLVLVAAAATILLAQPAFGSINQERDKPKNEAAWQLTPGGAVGHVTVCQTTTVEEIGGLPPKADAAGAEGATASGISQANGPQSDGTLESNGEATWPFTDGVRLFAGHCAASVQTLRFPDRGGSHAGIPPALQSRVR